jgi:hypothetical protein
MSLDLVILAPGSASTYQQALGVYYGERAGVPDEKLGAMAREIDTMFGDLDWPFTGAPILLEDHVELAIAHERWEEVIPMICDSAFRLGLVVLDPQSESLLRPGADALSIAGLGIIDVDGGGDQGGQVVVHYADGTVVDYGVVEDDSWSWPRRAFASLRFTRRWRANSFRHRS